MRIASDHALANNPPSSALPGGRLMVCIASDHTLASLPLPPRGGHWQLGRHHKGLRCRRGAWGARRRRHHRVMIMTGVDDNDDFGVLGPRAYA